jgi:hypothetical protein
MRAVGFGTSHASFYRLSAIRPASDPLTTDLASGFHPYMFASVARLKRDRR